MKILIAGAPGAFREWLTDRLRREKHDIYTISGHEDDTTAKHTVNYDFALTDDKLKFVLNSVMPDAVLFLGALDRRYDFSSEQGSSMDYLAGLTNLLVIMSSLGISRFVYLSSARVYGEDQNVELTEDCPKNPGSIRDLIVSEGESICLAFDRLTRVESVVLRFSDMYGLVSEGESDFCTDYFYNRKVPGSDVAREPEREKIFCPIYVSDAVDAVLRALTKTNFTGGVYNVSGPRTELSHILEKIGRLTGAVLPETVPQNSEEAEAEAEDEDEDEELSAVELSVDCSSFSAEFGYRPIVDIDSGLERMNRTLSKAVKKSKNPKAAKKRGKSAVLSNIAPLFENILAFAFFASAHIWAYQNSAILSLVDFVMLYVVIIALTFGSFQTGIAIFLSVALLLAEKTVIDGAAMLDTMLDLGTVVRILLLFTIGMLCSSSKDRMRQSLREKDNALRESQKELEVIHSINDANVKIKQELDNRLISYGDSLAKIYTTVEKLYALQPDTVFFSTVEVVMDIMNSNDVCIYIVTGDNFKMCRLIAKTPNSTRLYKNSVALSDLGELAETVARDEIFVNRDLTQDLPMMAAPVFSGRDLVSVIMLWDLGFESLTLYNVNRFLVVSRLISSVVERAYAYTQNMRELFCLPGTNILTEEAFQDILNAYKDASDKNTTSFQLILAHGIDPETGEPLNFHELDDKLHSLLRTNDFVGHYPQDETKLYVLLTNVDANGMQFVRSRLEKVNLFAEEVTV